MEEENKDLQKILLKKTALQEMAERLKINSDALKHVLKSTVIKGTKIKNSKEYKPATDEEFIAFITVANAYQLNPLTKEIYAFPDPKTGGIVPVVSTDGWNKIMLDNSQYKTHSYNYSSDMIKMPGSQECYIWIECVVEKKDDTKIVIREHLDECFRNLDFPNPWRTHPKRMLRHKTKIQAAREAFGFAGIYDRDEAERIIEAKTLAIEAPANAGGETDKLAEMAEKAKGGKEKTEEPGKEVDAEWYDIGSPSLDTTVVLSTPITSNENQKPSDEVSPKLKMLQEQIDHTQLSVKFAACKKLRLTRHEPDWVPKTEDECMKLIEEINRTYQANAPDGKGTRQ